MPTDSGSRDGLLLPTINLNGLGRPSRARTNGTNLGSLAESGWTCVTSTGGLAGSQDGQSCMFAAPETRGTFRSFAISSTSPGWSWIVCAQTDRSRRGPTHRSRAGYGRHDGSPSPERMNQFFVALAASWGWLRREAAEERTRSTSCDLSTPRASARRSLKSLPRALKSLPTKTSNVSRTYASRRPKRPTGLVRRVPAGRKVVRLKINQPQPVLTG